MKSYIVSQKVIHKNSSNPYSILISEENQTVGSIAIKTTLQDRQDGEQENRTLTNRPKMVGVAHL